MKDKKKQYIAPSMDCVNLCLRSFVCGSNNDGVNSNGANVDVRYGGVDRGGSMDPSANKRDNAEWGDLW